MLAIEALREKVDREELTDTFRGTPHSPMQLRESDMPKAREWAHYFRPRKTLRTLGLRKGMTFADLGCGYGTFSIPAAEIVGRKGTVYAIDIDQRMVNHVVQRSRRFMNVRALVGDITSSTSSVFDGLAPHGVDLVLLANVLHGTKNKTSLLKSASRILSRNGRLVVLNWNVEKTPRGPPMKLRPTPQQTIRYFKRAGYNKPRVLQVPLYHYAVIADKVSG